MYHYQMEEKHYLTWQNTCQRKMVYPSPKNVTKECPQANILLVIQYVTRVAKLCSIQYDSKLSKKCGNIEYNSPGRSLIVRNIDKHGILEPHSLFLILIFLLQSPPLSLRKYLKRFGLHYM